jgi:LuxR family transcriptional regulator, maltose regulon positive regulatory protein
VPRPRLLDKLRKGLQGKFTLISAPAGFGKTTLVNEWIAAQGGFAELRVAWLSLDERDSDPARFLAYFVAALQTIAEHVGQGLLDVLQAPQPPPVEAILTTLLNELSSILHSFVVVLDDYHLIESQPVDHALSFLLQHLPPRMRLVIVTRADPQLPLARLRAQGQLTELRAADLRFTPPEAAAFLNQVMGLNLAAEEIAALETRTEGWIAGLQLAAISMQGHRDTAGFIQSFTGSHHFVLDYLVEEVLQQQPEHVQSFLLRTSILDRLCGPLCDAVMHRSSISREDTLEYLEQANLFIVPLDDERRWYRYHHLFADLLRQRLRQNLRSTAGDVESGLAELHIRASQWCEDNGLELEAFRHAAAANDIERAERLIEGGGIPLYDRGAVTTIVNWLESLPATVLDARPSLWWRYGALLLVIGQTTGVQEKLDAAEAALHGAEADDRTRTLIGRLAAARSVLALTRYQAETMLSQSRRALAHLPSHHFSTRATANWTMGYAYLLQGDRAAARRALVEGISLAQRAGDVFTTILATVGLGNIQELENQLHQAAETYGWVLQAAGKHPLQIIHEAHLGMARVLYEWNDLDAAEQHARQSLYLARQYDSVVDRFVICEVFLARLKLARGEVEGAAALLAQASYIARQQNFAYRIPEVAATQVLVLLGKGHLAAAAHLAESHHLPLSQARVELARENPARALARLQRLHQQAEARGWEDERLKVMLLQALALLAQDEKEQAVQLLGDALALAEPAGFIRIFLDEGPPMARLLSLASARGMMPDYVGKLLTAFEAEAKTSGLEATHQRIQPMIEPLSQRELEVLELIARGLSNREISERLFLALDTVKGHNQRIFGKLQVRRRTEAVARARDLGLL